MSLLLQVTEYITMEHQRGGQRLISLNKGVNHPIQEDEEKDEMNTHFDHIISHISFELMSVVDFSWII